MLKTPNPPLRLAAIDFLNPAPLLYHFTHDPAATTLRARYRTHFTSPALCADRLRTGQADLGLIPIGAMPTIPGLRALPGCTIASLREVRSIQLIVRPGLALQDIRTVAADTASRSSAAYVKILLRAFHHADPTFTQHPADLPTMLAANAGEKPNDAALLIGDPALLALQQRDTNGTLRNHSWHDVAALWHTHTGLPWVAALWAIRDVALPRNPAQLVTDLTQSRDTGLAHIDELVQEWQPRIAIPPITIRTYLTQNIHYNLDAPCLQAIAHFFALAAETEVLPPYTLPLLET